MNRHTELLLEGVDSWNERRRTDSDFIPNFQDENIDCKLWSRGVQPPYDFRRVNFCRATLRGARLRNADLSGASFVLSDLTNADLSGSNLADARFVDAKLENTKLHKTNLTNANLAGVELFRADLFENVLDRKEHCDLRPVKDVSGLLDECKKLHTLYEDANLIFYYRGESRSGWELRPAVMRAAGGTFPLREHEAEMLVDLMSRWPEPFDNERSALAYWVLAQHHGLKTRLLDVTRNPSVALYNACSKDKSCDGVLHFFAVPTTMIKPYNSDTISILANFARLSHRDRNILLGKVGGQEGLFEYSGSLGRLYHYIRQEKPYFEQLINPADFFRVYLVEPQQRFERIRSQSGAFIISAFHERLERRVIRSFNSNIPTYYHHFIKIPGCRKEDILNELSMLNVTNEALFPSLDQAARGVTHRYGG